MKPYIPHQRAANAASECEPFREGLECAHEQLPTPVHAQTDEFEPLPHVQVVQVLRQREGRDQAEVSPRAHANGVDSPNPPRRFDVEARGLRGWPALPVSDGAYDRVSQLSRWSLLPRCRRTWRALHPANGGLLRWLRLAGGCVLVRRTCAELSARAPSSLRTRANHRVLALGSHPRRAFASALVAACILFTPTPVYADPPD